MTHLRAKIELSGVDSEEAFKLLEELQHQLGIANAVKKMERVNDDVTKQPMIQFEFENGPPLFHEPLSGKLEDNTSISATAAPSGVKIDPLFRIAELLSYALPRKTRLDVFEPAYNDIKGDFVKAMRRFKSKGARRWLAFCFGLHTSVLVVQCFWAMLSDRTKRAVLKFLPDSFRRWWGGA
jgi:hypothetical protein